MGVSSPDVGYRGYWVNDVSIVEDLPQHDAWNMTWKDVAHVKVLTDISKTSKLRFKVTLKATAGVTVYYRVVIGSSVVFEADENVNIWTPHVEDKDVTWKRGDIMTCQMKATSATGSCKEFKICGYLTPLGLY